MTIRIQQSSFELLPTGEYPAIVDNIEYDDGRFGQQLRWRFVLKGRHDGRVLTGWTSPTFSINSKLYAWCKAALGGSPIPKGQAFDSDSIIGRKVELVVIQRNGDNGTYNRIEEVRSIKPEAPHSSGDSDNPF